MFRALATAAVLAALTTGCAANSRNIPMNNAASLKVENQELWTRPTEVGYVFGPEITGTANQRSVLGFQLGESKPASTSVLAIMTSGAGLGGVGMHAAYNAVESRPGTEGIYVTRIATQSTGFLFLWRTSTSTVYGRALSIKDLGIVDVERADEERFKGRGPDLVIVKEGEVDLKIPGTTIK